MPVNAAADVKLSAIGTVLSVNRLNNKYNITQQAKKKETAFRQSFFDEPVMCKVVFPSLFLDHIAQPAILMTV